MDSHGKKRAAPGEPESGRDRKKVRLADARHIPVQNVALPPNVNIEKFIEARAFEINAMESAMKSARDGVTHRVFQTLPRHMRRRAASHDHRRVPKPYRERARAEIGDAVKPKKRIPKKGFSKRISKTEEYLRRQKDKTWLETHLWHAKRMHMANLWGYRLAETPTAKAFRPSHRAALHDAILHDASYFGIIEMIGPSDLLKRVLYHITDVQGVSPAAERYAVGSRTCDTTLYGCEAYPNGLIGPATVIWRPGTDDSRRTVWIRVHPAMFNEAWNAVTQAAGKTLQGTLNQNIEIADLRDEIVAFEVMGPKSSRVIAGALKPDWTKSSKKARKFWEMIPELSTVASVPPGLVAGLIIHDPRLFFPPKNASASDEPVDVVLQPNPDLAQSELWDPAARDLLHKPKFRKKDLDARRQKNLIPGTKLEPTADDSRIPIQLIQCSIGSTHHGWLLLAPRGWGAALMFSLVFTGTRVAALRQRATQHAEAGVRVFPADYPSTTAGREWWTVRGETDRAKWLRKPKAKRVGYERRGVRSPFEPDWGTVLGLEGPRLGEVSAQRIGADAEALDRKPSYWLLRGEGTEKALRQGSLQSFIAEGRAKRGLSTLTLDNEKLLRTALVSVRVNMVSKGAPGDMALIYLMENDKERDAWVRALEAERADSFDVDSTAVTELGKSIPSPGKVVGYLTTSSYSLSRGRGFGVGAVSVAKCLRLFQAASATRFSYLVKVRDRDGLICRAATLEIIP